jgi:hypothetical protein
LLAVTGLAGRRVVTLRRALSRGQHAADRAPQPVWPGPRVHATWPDRADPGPAAAQVAVPPADQAVRPADQAVRPADQAVGSADHGSAWPSWSDPGS